MGNQDKELLEIFRDSLVENWNSEALNDFNTDISYKYKDFAKKIEELHIVYKEAGIEKGDKIALIGRNSSHWAISFISVITYGAIVIPILDEFNPKDVIHILNHSQAKMFICDDGIWKNIKPRDIESVKLVISIKNFSVLLNRTGIDIEQTISDIKKLMKKLYPKGYSKNDVEFDHVDKDEVVVINYTSGTTSLTKGVMLTAQNLTSNIWYGHEAFLSQGRPLKKGLCILPLAHVYGLLFGFLIQVSFGASITFLGKLPSPKILLDGCKAVKPTMLVFVPLIFEKIYKSNIAPKLNKGIISKLRKIPFLDTIIHRRIGKKLIDLLGGDIYQVVVGGASINPDVEKFLKKSKFPFTVGYGMTECSPLISYADFKEFAPQSVGKAIPGRVDIRIVKENETDNIGEVQVKGLHVMKGYYNDPEGTKNTFTEDGWLKTGDLGCFDENDNLYLKGRSKTMLLGPSGENIYPESIESKLNNLPFISESIVMQNKKNKLIAFVYPDFAMIEKAKVSIDKLNRLMANNRRTLNGITAKYENVQRIIVVEEPFIKTPKNTPKRYGLDYLIEKYDSEKY